MQKESRVQKLQEILDSHDDSILMHLRGLDDEGLFEYKYKLIKNYNLAVKNNSTPTIESLKPLIEVASAYIELKSLDTGELDGGFILG